MIEKFTYRTNWMGPVVPGYEGYCCGRIDVRGGNLDFYGTEIGVPLIDSLSWAQLSIMLENFNTEKLWTWDQIKNEYEKRFGRKILMYEDEI